MTDEQRKLLLHAATLLKELEQFAQTLEPLGDVYWEVLLPVGDALEALNDIESLQRYNMTGCVTL